MGDYKKYYGKSGSTWFVNIEKIWVSHPDNKKGLNGDVYRFKLTDGTTEIVKGPWCSNPKSLLEDTGVNFFNQEPKEDAS